MDDTLDDICRCRALMNAAKDAAGLNPNSWAKEANVSESGVRGFLSGTSPNISLGYMDKLARAIGLRISHFVPSHGPDSFRHDIMRDVLIMWMTANNVPHQRSGASEILAAYDAEIQRVHRADSAVSASLDSEPHHQE